MKHKRLNRDGWGFQYYPYYQMRIDDDLFHGMVCVIRLTDGEENYWETPKAGRIQVTGGGMMWMQLILKKYCEDISKTDEWCAGIRKLVEERIAQGEPIKVCRDITNGNI